MVHFEFGPDWLTQPHPLHTFELAQGAIEGSVRGSRSQPSTTPNGQPLLLNKGLARARFVISTSRPMSTRKKRRLAFPKP